MTFPNHKKREMREQQLARCKDPALAHVIDENIGIIARMREQAERNKSWQDRLADYITGFSGSLWFYLTSKLFDRVRFRKLASHP